MKTLSRAAIFLFFLFLILPGQSFISAEIEKIDINTASKEKLQEIIWIGPVISQRIIDARPFYSVDELIRIKGIGEKRLEDIKKQGLAWVSPETKPDPEPATQLEPEPIIYPSNILINEILPSPEGPDAQEEWIEIFNQNNFEVDLSGWQITDSIGRTKTYTFPEKTFIQPKGFLVLSRPVTKITLNNDDDGLNLFQPDGKIADSMNYEKALPGNSFNRIKDNWVWSPVLTPEATNILPAPIEKKQPKEKLEANLPKTDIESKRGLAAVAEQTPGKISSFSPILIALSLAIFSGIIILTLKKKLKLE